MVIITITNLLIKLLLNQMDEKKMTICIIANKIKNTKCRKNSQTECQQTSYYNKFNYFEE